MITPHLEAMSARLGQARLETQAFVSGYAAKLALFQVAANQGDAAAMEVLRGEIHGMVDSILDSTAVENMLNRQVTEGLHDLSHLRGPN